MGTETCYRRFEYPENYVPADRDTTTLIFCGVENADTFESFIEKVNKMGMQWKLGILLQPIGGGAQNNGHGIVVCEFDFQSRPSDIIKNSARRRASNMTKPVLTSDQILVNFPVTGVALHVATVVTGTPNFTCSIDPVEDHPALYVYYAKPEEEQYKPMLEEDYEQ